MISGIGASCNKLLSPVGSSVHQVQQHQQQTQAGSTTGSIHKIQSSPLQVYLDQLLVSRGYSIKKISSSKSKYASRATSFQKVSYGTAIAQAIKDTKSNNNNTNELISYLEAGISPNPFDRKTHSFLVHTVCNEENYIALRLLLQYGSTEVVQCIDAFGRTPLHCVCWNLTKGLTLERMNAVKEILQYDSLMVNITDNSGADPFHIIPNDQISQWITFIEDNMVEFWPVKQCATVVQSESVKHEKDQTCRKPAQLTNHIAKMLSSGRMTVDEINLFRYDENISDTDTITSNIETAVVDTSGPIDYDDNINDDDDVSKPAKTLSTSKSNGSLLNDLKAIVQSMETYTEGDSPSQSIDYDFDVYNIDDEYDDEITAVKYVC